MKGETWNFSGTYSIRRINRHRCVSYIGGRCIEWNTYIYIYKEVNFTKYCPLCEEADTHEEKDPCNVCLFFPMNEHSEKPVYFKPKKK